MIDISPNHPEQTSSRDHLKTISTRLRNKQRALIRRYGMKRWAFMTLLGGAAAFCAIGMPAARAQPKMATIGILNFGNPEPFRSLLRNGLHDLGYTEGDNLRLEFRTAEGDGDRLPG